MLTVDKVGDVIHRTRTIQGIHRNQILEGRRLQLTQIFLHTRRLKLERTHGATSTIELICSRVSDVNGVDINLNSLRMLHIGYGILDDGEGLKTQEVHLDKSRILNHSTLILRYEHLLARLLILGSANRHPVGDVVTADNSSTGVYTRTTHITLQHLGVLDGVVQHGVVRLLGSLQLWHIFDGVLEVYLLVGNTVRHQLTQSVRLRQRQLLHTRNIL